MNRAELIATESHGYLQFGFKARLKGKLRGIFKPTPTQQAIHRTPRHSQKSVGAM